MMGIPLPLELVAVLMITVILAGLAASYADE
jgi:hypothetical protein